VEMRLGENRFLKFLVYEIGGGSHMFLSVGKQMGEGRKEMMLDVIWMP